MSTRILMTALIVGLFLLGSACLPVAHAEEPPVTIVSLQYPSTVQSGRPFSVTVQVAYSAKFGMIDIGVWDLQNDTVVQEMVSNASLQGPGISTYSLTLQAPNKSIVWPLAAIVRAWLEDSWFYDSAGENDFSVHVSDEVFLTLTGLQSNSTVNIDGKIVKSTTPTLTAALPPDQTDTVAVPRILMRGHGTRLVFVMWSDGVGSDPRSVSLSNNLTLTPIYRMQYLLSVSSDFGQPEGEGWYWAGDTALFGVTSDTRYAAGFLGLPVASYVFEGWSGDESSRYATTSILMTGPEHVNANWMHEQALNGSAMLVALFVIGSVVLFARAVFLLVRQNVRRVGLVKPVWIVSIFLIGVLVVFPTNVAANVPVPTKPSVVYIDDAFWYYWPQPSSDTCVFWLGGGLEYSQGGYLINPLEYESFGTIRFLQDISRYYCLLVLEKGSSPSQNTENRTIFQELIQGESDIGRQVHEWLNVQGYKHIFLAGYSVGAEAAATIAVADPAEWTTTDGLILITARLLSSLVGEAPMLNSNLLMLYGHAPTFEASGEGFYQRAPSEGWHGTGYLHKEYHVLDQMGHEVWSPLKDNSYSPIALALVVNFVQTSKALQFGLINLENNGPLLNPAYQIETVKSPVRVIWGTPFILETLLEPSNLTHLPEDKFALIVFDIASMKPLTSMDLSLNSKNTVPLLVPPIYNSSRVDLSLLVVKRVGMEWVPASLQFMVLIAISNEVELTVTGLVGNSTIYVDTATYVVPSDGNFQLNTTIGNHIFEAPESIQRSNADYTFVEWNDGNASSIRTINLEHDTALKGVYFARYFVNVTSPIGGSEGTDWYYVNSTVVPGLGACTQGNDVFQHWSTPNGNYSIGEPIPVTSPVNVQAVWTQVSAPTSAPDQFLSASILLFLLLLLLNLRLSRKPE